MVWLKASRSFQTQSFCKAVSTEPFWGVAKHVAAAWSCFNLCFNLFQWKNVPVSWLNASFFDLSSHGEDRISSRLAPSHRPARAENDLGSDCVKLVTQLHFSMIISLHSHAEKKWCLVLLRLKTEGVKQHYPHQLFAHWHQRCISTDFFFNVYLFPTERAHIIASPTTTMGPQSHLGMSW